MALSNSKSSTQFQIQQSQPILFLNFFRLTIFLFLHFPFTNSLSFNFSSFQISDSNITYEGDAYPADGAIQVTRTANSIGSTGRAYYSMPIHLWDSDTGKLRDFNTHFSFNISASNDTVAGNYGDGLTFFLYPHISEPPEDSGGGCLGIFETPTALNVTYNHIVAVEFDTFHNDWDPEPMNNNTDHVGIDVNSAQAVTYLIWNSRFADMNSTANAWVNYNSITMTFSVYLTYDEENPVFEGYYTLSHVVNLTEVLPEWVYVGFSAATGLSTEFHTILSWTFESTLEGSPKISTGRKTNLPLIIGLVLSIGALSCGVGLFWVMRRKKTILGGKNDMDLDASIDDITDFEKGKGPRRFSFRELSHATNNFSEQGKLGQGGFGVVYKGVLIDTKEEIAVKRISRGSKQGKKEYVSEVKIISRLRHRNLVQLIGWCHERGDLLLVYEFMPNGSLDTHLFGKKSKLSWTIRYKIAVGLASALLYLHEEWEQCVIHRDIKSSNIMLDSNYNAKLGDFGLARLVDHELGLETTVVAGTMGYLAPECVFTGKASKELDVYSFGVVALEIACGRKPMELNSTSSHATLSDCVWSLYEKGQLFETVDKDLTMEYDESQVERLMLVGLWCCHTDPNLRPSIRQVINILSFEAPLPVLPSQKPKPAYSSPPRAMPSYSISDQSSCGR